MASAMGVKKISVNPVNARTPLAIINQFSSGASATASNAMQGQGGPKAVLSGALTANILVTSLNISGAGSLFFLGVSTQDTTSRTIRAKLTLDGVVVFDATSSAISTTADGIILVGTVLVNASGLGFCYGNIPFQNSCVLQIASSLSETNKIATLYSYATY